METQFNKRRLVLVFLCGAGALLSTIDFGARVGQTGGLSSDNLFTDIAKYVVICALALMGILGALGNSFTLVHTFATIVTMLTFVGVFESIQGQAICWEFIHLALNSIVAQLLASDLHSMAKKSDEKKVTTTWMFV